MVKQYRSLWLCSRIVLTAIVMMMIATTVSAATGFRIPENPESWVSISGIKGGRLKDLQKTYLKPKQRDAGDAASVKPVPDMRCNITTTRDQFFEGLQHAYTQENPLSMVLCTVAFSSWFQRHVWEKAPFLFGDQTLPPLLRMGMNEFEDMANRNLLELKSLKAGDDKWDAKVQDPESLKSANAAGTVCA